MSVFIIQSSPWVVASFQLCMFLIFHSSDNWAPWPRSCSLLWRKGRKGRQKWGGGRKDSGKMSPLFPGVSCSCMWQKLISQCNKEMWDIWQYKFTPNISKQSSYKPLPCLVWVTAEDGQSQLLYQGVCLGTLQWRVWCRTCTHLPLLPFNFFSAENRLLWRINEGLQSAHAACQ